MIGNINIKGNDKVFQYLVEYTSENLYKSSENFGWFIDSYDDNCIHLFDNNIEYFRYGNIWNSTNDCSLNDTYLPKDIKYSKIKIHIPNFSLNSYKKGVKYAVSINTWLNGHKIDLGSFVFNHTSTYSNSTLLKRGNNEYCECIEFDIMDPFEIIYSNEWTYFRNNVCKEPLYQNNTEAILNVSLYSIVEYENQYIIDSIYNGGFTSLNISKENDYLNLVATQEYSPLKLKLELSVNSSYNWLLNYLFETYNINVSHKDIYFEVVIKNNDTIIVGPKIGYNMNEEYGKCIQYITYKELINNPNIRTFFSTWDAFEEGWSFAVSLNVIDRGYIHEDFIKDKKVNNHEYQHTITFKEDDDIEILNVVSNEIPITQEIFSRYIKGSDEIIDLKNMNINNYTVVNKIENKIIQLERPNDSKSKIIQPVFFRVKDSEVLTLHPNVTENICINLDDYKSKVDTFVLQIDNCKFEQIGANKYGIIFKIHGNTLSKELKGGTYYILNENFELVTSGKYNCVR